MMIINDHNYKAFFILSWLNQTKYGSNNVFKILTFVYYTQFLGKTYIDFRELFHLKFTGVSS